MKAIASELALLIARYKGALLDIPESKRLIKPGPQKWSKTEIIGHLVDSAQSNTRRFIIAQYEETPKIVYDQEAWVKFSNYQQYDFADLVEFWYLSNKHICHILENMTAENEKKTCMTKEVHDLKWLALDYIKHLKHHLHQVLEREEIPYP